MKKYLFGLIAIAFAVTFSAFTVVKKANRFDVVSIQFLGDNESDFQNETLWKVNEVSQVSCDEELDVEMACKFEIDEANDDSSIDFVDGEDVKDYIIEQSISSYSQLKSEAGVSVIAEKERQE